jgi:pimeloyl-ACP methyl ester carboxylesterase
VREGNQDIRPFQVDIPQGQLDDLHDRLNRTRWVTGELTGAGWSHGVPLEAVKELAEYWGNGYDWRAHEARLNSHAQFTTEIDGTGVHFLHVRSPQPDALPLILTHGWPGSVVEYLDVVGPLTDPGAHGGDPADAFHVVVPSIPGFAFSGPTPDAGWDARRIARALAELMRRLGYRRYGAVGNDAGSVISPEIGRADPDGVAGVHVTQVFSFPSGDPTEFEGFGEEDYRRLGLLQRFLDEHSGFNKLQATRPATLAHALADSPVGQLAWNLDLLRGFGEQPPEIQKRLDPDFILTNVMLYWLTGTGGSSARWYYEEAHAKDKAGEPFATPTGVSVFPADFQSIRRLAERDHNIVYWSELDHGGHFAGTDAPDLLTGELRTFFRGLR